MQRLASYSGALSLRVKRPGREADHAPLYSAMGKNRWSHTFTPPYLFMAWRLVKQGYKDNFAFTEIKDTRTTFQGISRRLGPERVISDPTP